MQTNANQCKNDLFEEIEFQEIGEKSSKFGEFYGSGHTPDRVVEWKIPEFRKTLKENSAKFRIYPFAIKTGRAIGYVLAFVLSVFGQALWFVVLVSVSVLKVVLQSLFGQGYVRRQRHKDKQRQDIDWRDLPTGWDAKGQAYVRKKMKERDRQRQGKVNSVNVNVNVDIENH